MRRELQEEGVRGVQGGGQRNGEFADAPFRPLAHSFLLSGSSSLYSSYSLNSLNSYLFTLLALSREL